MSSPGQGPRGARRDARQRVLLVDDHPLMRAGLAQLVAQEPNLAVCGEASNAREAFEKFRHSEPDLVVVDISLPGRDGLELIKDIHAFAPNVPILVVSMQDEEIYVERALHAGAHGYIMKEAGGASVLQAIRQVLAGGMYVSPRISTLLLSRNFGPEGRHAQSSLSHLSDREFEVFRCIGRGKSTNVIAEELGLSAKTVEVHRFNIRKKLGLRNSTALVHYAVKWIERTGSGGTM